MPRQYTLMSSDGHLEVRPERWTHRVPAQYRDRAPRTVAVPGGGDALLIEGQPLMEANFLDLRAGRPAGQWQPFGIKVEDAAGTGSAEQRVKEQDIDGMEAEVLFPAMVAGPAFWRNISHDEVYKAVIRAYNDWLGEEYWANPLQDWRIAHGRIECTNAALDRNVHLLTRQLGEGDRTDHIGQPMAERHTAGHAHGKTECKRYR